jgi:AcrR family transcriptional regulator
MVLFLGMQRPKEHVRAQFVAAASALFAEVGYATTTMGAVAERAGSSIGNLYKYFPSKEALFEVVVPSSFVTDVRRLTRARIEALGTIRDIRLVPADASYHVLAGDLLDLCLAHRERIVILLGRAEGTPFEDFPEDFTKRLVEWALDYVKGAWPTVRPTPEMRFALRRIYRNYLAGVAEAFMTFREEKPIREAIAHLTAHHQGGLKHLFETAANAAKQDKGVHR